MGSKKTGPLAKANEIRMSQHEDEVGCFVLHIVKDQAHDKFIQEIKCQSAQKEDTKKIGITQ